MATQQDNILPFGNKQENNGADNRGRLTAHEFNQVVSAVNANTQAVGVLTAQSGGLSLRVLNDEAEYEAVAEKDASTLYIIME